MFSNDIGKYVCKYHCVKNVRVRSYSGPHFPHSDWIRRDTLYLSVFSPNAGKWRPDYLRIRTIITQCIKSIFIHNIVNTSVVLKDLEKGSIWLWIQIILNVMIFSRDINFDVNFHRECQSVTIVRRIVTKC